MKKLIPILLALALLAIPAVAAPDVPDFNSEEFETMYTYTGDDLGSAYISEDLTVFRLWAPTADEAYVNIYEGGDTRNATDKPQVFKMEPSENGTWYLGANGNYKNKYYTYSVTIDGIKREAVDPYAKAAGVNGKRGMVVDLRDTNPEGWESDSNPEFVNMTDAVIYELHVRDLSTSDTSGIENKGKFLGLTETGTKSPSGEKTGLDHMVELGVTHVHLLPSFDYLSVDESRLESNQFNWGYDPQNYNVPEGSYSTDPYDGNVRIKEFKEMVAALHNSGIRVVMDVVYNHTGATQDSNLNILVPDYYYRKTSSGTFSNGSGCGNETASERAMVRKLIVDSVVYWASEYHVDGFRFDLMALHDIETMNEVRSALNEIDPTIIVYGEGWTGGTTPLPSVQQALKDNASDLDSNIAVFSDDIRDGIKGSVFKKTDKGYVNGHIGRREDVKFGVVGSVLHPGVDYSRVSYSKAPWAAEPTQTINYASAHDNMTLWDKLSATWPKASGDELIAMNKLSAAIVLTSQGIPFFHAGEELARSKGGNENSYKSPDSVNQINWENKTEYKNLFEYYKGLIALRKEHPAFRMTTADDVRNAIEFIDTEFSLMAYTIDGSVTGDNDICVVVNVDTKSAMLTLPKTGWDVYVDGEKAGTEVLGKVNSVIKAKPKSAYVLIYTGIVSDIPDPEPDPETEPETTPNEPEASPEPSLPEVQELPELQHLPEINWGLILGGIAAVCGAAAVVIGVVMKKRKK